MLSVKLVRSLVLGESIITHHHDDHDDDDDGITHVVEYDADDDNDYHLQINNNKNKSKISSSSKKKKMPLLLFIPTKELISDTFRLASIARDIGMDFHPSPSLSHLLFSWPSSSPSPPSSSSYSPFSTPSNNRPSVSSSTATTTTTTTLSSSSSNDAVPLPFPSLSTVSSISLLRYFVSLTKGLFKLVFLEIDANSRFNYCNYDYECLNLVSRVSGKRVESMEDFSRVLAGNGWALFRSSEINKTASLVYLFRKNDSNRVRVRPNKMINGGGECRVRELRLPTLDFKNGVPLRILQYILLMTDDLFYLA